MEHFLICANPCCRFVLDLQETARPLRRPAAFLNECPECGSQWSANCPFCVQPLRMVWRGHLPHCGHCHHKLHAEAKAAA
jgi:hypothetical protein